jgi:ketosteroid isomerase-like protein
MRIALTLCLLVLLVVVAGRADAQTETHAAVSQALEAFRQASLANDASKLDTLMADDCTAIVGPGLLVTKPQLLSALRDGSLIFDEVTFDDVVIRIYGSTAVVTHVMNIKERLSGTPLAGRYRTTRVFFNADGGWRLIAFQNTLM